MEVIMIMVVVPPVLGTVGIMLADVVPRVVMGYNGYVLTVQTTVKTIVVPFVNRLLAQDHLAILMQVPATLDTMSMSL